jgi:hypothetical protein
MGSIHRKTYETLKKARNVGPHLNDGHVLSRFFVETVIQSVLEEIERKDMILKMPGHVTEFMLLMTELSLKTSNMQVMDSPDPDDELIHEPVHSH